MTCLRRRVKELSRSFLRRPARGIPLSINRRGVACIHQTPLTGQKAFVYAACSPFRDRSNPADSLQLGPKRRLVPNALYVARWVPATIFLVSFPMSSLRCLCCQQNHLQQHCCGSYRSKLKICAGADASSAEVGSYLRPSPCHSRVAGGRAKLRGAVGEGPIVMAGTNLSRVSTTVLALMAPQNTSETKLRRERMQRRAGHSGQLVRNRCRQSAPSFVAARSSGGRS